jgi:glycosyltransferase involved in cell wall biosynthesis
MAAADVGVVSQAAGIDATSIPSKACYMMAAGLAMIGISDWGSDLSGIITRGNCGESVQPGDVPSFVAAVLRLLDNPDLLSSRKRAARCIAEEYFSKHRNVLRIQTALERVL